MPAESVQRCPGMSETETRPAPAPTVAAGLMITLCALAAAGAVTVVARLVTRFTVWFGWITIPAIWPLLAGSLLAGAVLVARPRGGGRAGVVAFVCAVQLVGGGVAASRDWFNVAGASTLPTRRLAVVLPLTMVLVVAATIACCVASAVMWRRTSMARAQWWRPVAPAYLFFGVVVAVGVPFAWSALISFWQVNTLGETALRWSLPWGASLAVAGWLDQRSRRAALITVITSAVATAAFLLSLFLQ